MRSLAQPARAMLPILVLGLALAGCAQTTGDLGRARQNVWEQKLGPAYDQMAEGWAREAMTSLPETPKEREMRARMWRYYAMPLKGQLLFADNRILTRSAILSKKTLSTRTDRYYKLLRAEGYRSTQALYRRVDTDMAADLAMMPDLFRTICAVRQNDRRREIALSSRSDLGSEARQNLRNRMTLNEATISQFIGVLDFRNQSYRYAIAHLLAEEPDPLGRDLDLKLADLRASHDLARADRFCAMPAPVLRGTAGASGALGGDRPIALGG